MNNSLPPFLAHLDDDQKAAVTAGDGIVRVAAGAGTGKTTTLIGRILYLLVEKKIPASSILVVTFTNKAAEEVRARLETALRHLSLSPSVLHAVRIGTFHSHCARFLRRSARLTGIPDNFTICDEEDSRQLVQTILRDKQIFEKYLNFSPDPEAEEDIEKQRDAFYKANSRAVQELTDDVYRMIQRWKENGLDRRALDEGNLPARATSLEQDAIDVLYEYEIALEGRGILDFCDLITKTCRVLEADPRLHASASRSVQHMLIDEFQDVNRLQKRMVDLLSDVHGNLFVVGDTDQSIYAFRGSTPQIMERMEDHLHYDVTLRLNRRCSQQILAAANPLVEANHPERGKDLFSDKAGQRVDLFHGANEFAEAALVTRRIQSLIRRGVPPHEIAVLTRTARFLKPIEASLLSRHIPYRLLRGTSLLDTEEIKDLVAYLRLVQNSYDDFSFSRVINKPARGIGPSATHYIFGIAMQEAVSPIEACESIVNGEGDRKINKRARENIKGFLALLQEASAAADERRWGDVFDLLMRESGYLEWLRKRDSETSFRRRDSNLKRVRSVITRGSYQSLMEVVDALTLSLDETAVETVQGRVLLSTIHTSKGMEFDHVFCPALEQGVLPHQRSLDDEEADVDLDDPWDIAVTGSLQEERRLAHVAFTRAREGLHVSYAQARNKRKTQPSVFLPLAFPEHFPEAAEAEREQELAADHSHQDSEALGRLRALGQASAV